MNKRLISKDKTLERFRKLCLTLPETSETSSHGHPNFRAGNRTFAAFEWFGGRPSMAFKLGADEVDQMLMQGDSFFATPYGRGLWVSLWADGRIPWKLVEDLVERGFRHVALKRLLTRLDEKRANA